jgi:hypothetical protein
MVFVRVRNDLVGRQPVIRGIRNISQRELSFRMMEAQCAVPVHTHRCVDFDKTGTSWSQDLERVSLYFDRPASNTAARRARAAAAGSTPLIRTSQKDDAAGAHRRHHTPLQKWAPERSSHTGQQILADVLPGRSPQSAFRGPPGGRPSDT